MSELSMFEHRLAASLEAYAGPRRDVDAIAIARTAANAERSRGSATPIRSRRNVALLVAAALTAVLLVGGALAVGSGLVRLSSIVPPPPPSLQSSPATTQSPSPGEATASPSPMGPLGGGLILVHDLARFGDRSIHDVVALDAGTGERTLLGTLPGQDVWTYQFQRSADRNHVLILTNNGLGALSNLDGPTEASKPFGFIPDHGIDVGSGVVLSPGGDRIAGVDDFDRPTRIVVSGVGGGSRTIRLPAGVKRLLIHAWSPDQSALIAAGCRPCNTTQTPDEHQTADIEHLYVVPLDGSPWRELLDEDNGYLSATWSPDGSTLAVTDFECVPTTNMPRCPPGGKSTMSLLAVADGSERRLTSGTERTEMAAWSPDGRRLAYIAGKAGDILTDGGIFVVDADGTNALKIADTSDDEPPIWSPDGRWLLFKKDWSTTEWWVVPADGGVPRSIGNYGGVAW
jgi:WD40 repeat protein